MRWRTLSEAGQPASRNRAETIGASLVDLQKQAREKPRLF
jgi:hypothetical protein